MSGKHNNQICISYKSQYHTCISSLNSDNNPPRYALSSPLYRQSHQGTEGRGDNLPKFVQPGGDGARIQVPVAWLREGNGNPSSTLTWKIPWMEEPGGLQSMGSLRVRHDWVTSLSLFTCMHWRRKWQPTPVFLPGESQGRGSLVGCHLWGCTDLDTTETT